MTLTLVRMIQKIPGHLMGLCHCLADSRKYLLLEFSIYLEKKMERKREPKETNSSAIQEAIV